MYHVVAFDFDGTLTRKDTLLEFIKYVRGSVSFWLGIFLYSPILIAYKLRLYPNWKAKQLIFSHFFKGMPYCDFQRFGREFAEEVERISRCDTVRKLHEHQQKGDRIYVISASIEDWVRPWCERHGVHRVLGTQVETDEQGRLTGRFLTSNCYGVEKVKRLEACEPDRSAYKLTAYGDSEGDRPLINFADTGVWVR